MIGSFATIGALGHAETAGSMAAIHGAVLSAMAYAPRALRALRVEAFASHALASGILAAGAVWTALPVPSGRSHFPVGRVLTALGAVIALAGVLASIIVIGHLTAVRALSERALSAVESAALCALAVGALTLVLQTLLDRSLCEQAILASGGSLSWAEVGARTDIGCGSLFRVADIVPPGAWYALAGDFLRRRRIWGVVLADGQTDVAPDVGQHSPGTESWRPQEEGFREQRLGRVDIDHLDPTTIAAWRIRHRRPDRLIGRRGVDIGLSVLLLIFTLPLMLLVALLIRIGSPGPVLYRQERVGLGGQSFRVIKFRSMRRDAEAQSGPQWAGPTDPRVTRVGALLRRTRIDELPQLWNVLRGEMSVIGPRPERPFFVERLAATIPAYNERCVVKPGITGWAQVNYRYGASTEDARVKLSYDLYYVKHRSCLLDLRILAATVRVVLLQQGAR